MKYLKLFIPVMFFFGSCSHKSLKTVEKVNLSRYSGKWYEIAAIPKSFEKGCKCTMAEYTANSSGTITVRNSCIKKGHLKVKTARASVLNTPDNSRLKVRFGLFSGKYYIIDLAADYSYAVVGHPNRKYLWILSRNSTLPDNTYQNILERVQKLGFKYDAIKPTVQDCDNK